MAWKIELDSKAEKEFGKLAYQAQKLIRNYLRYNVLRQDHPSQLGKALSGNKKGLWRYRVDKFRIICKFKEDQLIVLVIKIANRDVVYTD
jgi:mRNA interferase RelE/StbE